MKLADIIKNKVVFYLFSRYFTYFIEFLTSLIIAAKLGPFYFGVWGSIILILNYFQQIHFGIANSANVLLVHNINDQSKCRIYISNSLILVTYLSIIVMGLYVLNLLFDFSFFEKYGISKYVLSICVIASLQYYRMLFINIFRVYNNLNYVIFAQSIIIFLNFAVLFLFEGETLINWLIAGYILGNGLTFLMAVFSKTIPPIKIGYVSTSIQGKILDKGFFLFLYNSCFYFILISLRTIVSAYYTVSEFGIFTFSWTLANAMILLLDAVAFVAFPKLISKLSSDNHEEVKATVSSLQKSYVTSAHFLVYVAILVFPLLLYFLPKYDGAVSAFNIISLTILINTSSFVYCTILVARNRERKAALASIIALVVNAILALSMTKVLGVGYSYISFATMISYVMFTLIVAWFTKDIFDDCSLYQLVKTIFPSKIVIPVLISIAASVYEIKTMHLVTFLVFIYLNRFDLIYMRNITLKLLKNSNIVNL